jgi:hypothetical protein
MRRKMGKIIAISVLVLLLWLTGTASATILTVELPGLIGDLKPYPNGSTDVFDFGTNFLSIDEVRIRMSGTFTPAQARSIISGELFDILPGIVVYMDPGVGSCFTDLNLQQSPFDIENPFNLKYGATWDFLLDGTDQLNADLYTQPILAGSVIVTPPTAEISEAYIIIEGVIPEPATVLFLGLGGLAVCRRGRGSRADKNR